MKPPTSPQVYKPKPLFYLYTLLFLLATLWLVSEAWRRQAWVWWLMAVGVGFIALRMTLGAFARAEFDGETFVYRTPGRGAHRVTRRQLARVEMGGRRHEALIIEYYPLDDQGLVDTAHTRFINCVPLEDQAALMERLLQAMDGVR